MTERTLACEAHRALVSAATGPDPDDAVLERYATEVPACEPCQRALAGALSVHPVILQRAGARAPQHRPEPHPGLRALMSQVQPAQSRRAWTLGLAVGGFALAAVALAAFLSRPGIEAPEPEPALATTMPAPLSPTPPPPHAPAPSPVVVPHAVAPAPLSVSPPSLAAAPSEGDDAVAVADDWPAPPFVDLRTGTAKSVTPAVRSVQLVLAGGAPYAVGSSVGLTVVASADATFAVCVSGPERGVVWRGVAPAGRTDLSRDGRLQSFAFSAPGTYRFAVAPEDLDHCSDPVHVVEVGVAP